MPVYICTPNSDLHTSHPHPTVPYLQIYLNTTGWRGGGGSIHERTEVCIFIRHDGNLEIINTMNFSHITINICHLQFCIKSVDFNIY